MNSDNSFKVSKRDANGTLISVSTGDAETLADLFAEVSIDGMFVALQKSPIPTTKSQNFRRGANVPEEEKLYVLVDATIFGSARNGVGFSENGMYVNSGFPEKPMFFSYEELVRSQVKVGSTSYYVQVDERRIAIPGATMDAYQLASMIELARVFFANQLALGELP